MSELKFRRAIPKGGSHGILQAFEDVFGFWMSGRREGGRSIGRRRTSRDAFWISGPREKLPAWIWQAGRAAQFPQCTILYYIALPLSESSSFLCLSSAPHAREANPARE